jgi:spore coat polysaccharide biosynthesis predicted glycosyltransferase SpsG
MKVVIITEGNRKLGYGHIYRCNALYDAFLEMDIVPAMIVNGDDNAKEMLDTRRHIILNWFDEQDRIFKNLKDVDIVILDSYLADINFYLKISELSQIPAYIDDNSRIEYPTGVIVNGTFFGDKVAYHKRSNIKYLLGSNYIPVRKEFWDIEKKEINDRVKTFLISFGAIDQNNLTAALVHMLSKMYHSANKIAVIGRGASNIKLVHEAADNNTRIISCSDIDEYKKALMEADIGITSSGQGIFELARYGLPIISIGVADNAMDNIISWRKPDFLSYAGWWDKPEMQDKIISEIKLLESKKIRQERSDLSRKILDGQGCRRTVQTLIEMAK